MKIYIDKIQKIFRQVLEDESIVINLETKADDIEDWDSLNHIYLIIEIEKVFNIKFTTQEIENWKNVGDMIEALKKHE
jgi:acyl carrier protein